MQSNVARVDYGAQLTHLGSTDFIPTVYGKQLHSDHSPPILESLGKGRDSRTASRIAHLTHRHYYYYYYSSFGDLVLLSIANFAWLESYVLCNNKNPSPPHFL